MYISKLVYINSVKDVSVQTRVHDICWNHTFHAYMLALNKSYHNISFVLNIVSTVFIQIKPMTQSNARNIPFWKFMGGSNLTLAHSNYLICMRFIWINMVCNWWTGWAVIWIILVHFSRIAVTVYVLAPSMTSPGSHPNPMHANSIHTICMNIYNQNYDIHSYVNYWLVFCDLLWPWDLDMVCIKTTLTTTIVVIEIWPHLISWRNSVWR